MQGMTTRTLAIVAGLCLGLGLTACHHEPKPDRKGVFIVTMGTLSEMKTVDIDTEFTPEGFAIRSFKGEPMLKFKNGDSYFILYGDYKPYDLKKYVERSGRFEEDTSAENLRNTLQSGGISGEKDMFKCKVGRELKVGNYVLEVQQGDSTVLNFPFRVD